jgi:hypothetical protein
MSTPTQIESNQKGKKSERSAQASIKRILRSVGAREVGIFLGFALLTGVMTWPWILHLRDAVADNGDPYMIAWTLWWDFHQTFHNPLHLFDANVFYPYRYTLAFSENDYGIALLCFPLFAMGLRPLTVSAIATFFGFAFSGYGAFRLTRTLTGSNASAWLAVHSIPISSVVSSALLVCRLDTAAVRSADFVFPQADVGPRQLAGRRVSDERAFVRQLVPDDLDSAGADVLSPAGRQQGADT